MKGAPNHLDQIIDGEWRDMGETPTHNLDGADGNKDYRGLGKWEGYQVIIGGDKNAFISAENMGSYDYISPTTLGGVNGHYKIDEKT